MEKVLPAALGLVLASAATAAPRPAIDPLLKPIVPDYARQWLGPQTPMKLYGGSYFVGFKGLSVVVIKTPAGAILIDGAVPQAVPALKANLKRVGVDIKDVRYILNTESHFDHASGIAALARDSGAAVLTSPKGAAALRSGSWDAADPQAKSLERFPPIAKAQGIGDGQTISLGGVTVTAHHTPGHTPGSTSWSWRSCEGSKCVNLVFSSSFNPVSSDDFHYGADKSHGDLTPAFRASIRKMSALPCDILVSAHPQQSGLDTKLAKAEAQRLSAPFLDPNSCRAYAKVSEGLLDARIAKEKTARPPK